MACNKSGHLRRLLDILMLVIVWSPVIITELVSGLKPFQRGFYCNDESLSKPYRPSTVSTLVVIIVGLLLNVIVIAICEPFAARKEIANNTESNDSQLCGLRIRSEIVKFFEVFFLLLFGAGTQQGITNATKFLVGRLRPHFLDVCQPNFTAISCTDGQGLPRYVTENICTGTVDHKTLDMRLSFPSGHASLGTYCMIFLVMYLHARITCRRLRLVRTVLQVTALWLAIGVCVTRISDYKHHWSDVLGGAAIGGIIALLMIASWVEKSCSHNKEAKKHPGETRLDSSTASQVDGEA